MQENNFEKAYSEAFDLARRQLLNCDLALCCESSGAVLLEQTAQSATVELQYLNTAVRLVLPACSCTTVNQVELHVWDKILLLHYLAAGGIQPVKTREVGFKELKSAALYFGLFEKRCLNPLLKAFGATPELLLKCADDLHGRSIAVGDCAVRLQVLPKVPISIVIWKGDEEFAASASILFESSIEQYLSAEDIVVICQRMVLKLIGKW